MRRRIWKLLFCGLLALLLCACGNDGAGGSDMSADGGAHAAEGELPEDGAWSEGRYLRSKNSNLIIFTGLYGDVCTMSAANETVSFEELEDGDLIRIYLDCILETWPGQTRVYAVEKLEDGDLEDIPSDKLEMLREYGWIE